MLDIHPGSYADSLHDELAAVLSGSLGRNLGQAADVHPALEWARSGAMALSGPVDGPPRLCRAPVATAARGALDALASIVSPGAFADFDAPALLGERAALSGENRKGRVSVGGSARLVRATDGWIAVNLARAEDVEALEAWLEADRHEDAWAFVERHAERRPARDLVERGRWLGLAVALSQRPRPGEGQWFSVPARGPVADRRKTESVPLVVDLSSLWAGPLCTHLLERIGARVVKVESAERPDAARVGSPALFDLLHAGKRSVVLPFRAADGRCTLRRLLEAADIVVESSRPRALAQLGIDAESHVRERPGVTWLSITGYGRSGPEGSWVAFGDDAGVAGGSSASDDDVDSPVFYGDAVADPLTGIHAALAAWTSYLAGGGHLLDVSLRGVVARTVLAGDGVAGARVEAVGTDRFEVVAPEGERASVAAPRARRLPGRARRFGVDTGAVLAELRPAC